MTVFNNKYLPLILFLPLGLAVCSSPIERQLENCGERPRSYFEIYKGEYELIEIKQKDPQIYFKELEAFLKCRSDTYEKYKEG